MKEKNSSLTSNKNNSDVFNYEGAQYRLVISAESRGATSVKIFRLEAGQADKLVGKPLTESDFLSSDADARQKFRNLVNSAEALRKAAMKPAPGQPKPTFAQLKALKADLNAKRTILIQEIITDHSCTTLGAGCFGAGTKLWTELGYRNIEDIQPGERVYSRDQWDAGGEIAAKIVEEVFTRFAGIWEVVAGGQTIRTTMEHPFFVKGKGWTVAHELQANDKLLCADGTTVSVEAVRDTGEWEVVYNLRVSEWHTYFVGGEDSGAIWAHNTYESLRRALNAVRQQQPTFFPNGIAHKVVKDLLDYSNENTHDSWYKFEEYLRKKNLSNRNNIRDLWWIARGQDPALLAQTQGRTREILVPSVVAINAALTPTGVTDMQFGIRGSLATGYSFDKNLKQEGRPWDGNNFDVDAFVKSDLLRGGLYSIPPSFGSSTFISLADINRAQGFKQGQQWATVGQAVRQSILSADSALKHEFQSRLKPGVFTYKVFPVTGSAVTGLPL